MLRREFFDDGTRGFEIGVDVLAKLQLESALDLGYLLGRSFLYWGAERVALDAAASYLSRNVRPSLRQSLRRGRVHLLLLFHLYWLEVAHLDFGAQHYLKTVIL